MYGYDPYISVSAAWSLSRSVKHISNVEDIYRECDYITIHVPLLDSTRKMIGADAIAMMKPTAIVLNFARDLLVDEEAMVDALAAGKIKKYVSDFPNTTTVGAKGSHRDTTSGRIHGRVRGQLCAHGSARDPRLP